MTAIEFLTRTGQTCTPLRQEFILLSDVLGVSALVDALNNPPVGTATESSVLGPFFTEDAPDGASYFPFPVVMRVCVLTHKPPFDPVPFGESIASEGKGAYMYVEGHVRDTKGTPIPNAVIDTWETDDKGEANSSSVPVFSALTPGMRLCHCHFLRILRHPVRGSRCSGLSWSTRDRQ
jgi:protocatechuate 3,4-dioxygenase beta subunit